MAVKLTGSFITIDQSNINTSKTSVQQLVDIVQTDIASTDSTTRKSYEVFTSGGIDQNPITSSLYQTVFDQEFTLGTANPLFDITIGSYLERAANGDLTLNGLTPTEDAGGKLTGFNSSTPMMREKSNIYRQFAQNLLGDANSAFFTSHDALFTQTEDDGVVAASGTLAKKIKGAVFICFRRLFTRDNIFKGSFGIRIHKSASKLYSEFLNQDDVSIRTTGTQVTNLIQQADINEADGNDSIVISDTIAATNTSVSPVYGEVSTLSDSSGNHVGVIFYDSGIIVLDVERTFDSTQFIRGEINSTRTEAANPSTIDTAGPFAIYGYLDGEAIGDAGWYYPVFATDNSEGSRLSYSNFNFVDSSGNESVVANIFYAANSVTVAGARPSSGLYPAWSGDNNNTYYANFEADDGETLHNGNLYPSLWTSGTIDEVLDHLCVTRFGRDTLSAMSFRNETVINSSLVFCRAAPTQLNYSTNPTYTDADGKIVAVTQQGEPFCFVTTVGLYDAEGDLLAVAKTSRPIEKNPETDLSIRIRLDY